MAKLHVLPCLDSEQMAASRRQELDIARDVAAELGRSAVKRGLRLLALNFANGVQPGGGFLDGARAQEEVLCRSSALYLTLIDDPMYEEHRKRRDQTPRIGRSTLLTSPSFA